MRKLENLIEKADVDFNCRFTRSGCNEEIAGEDLDEHEADCSFRTVYCLRPGCGERIVLRMLDNHL